MNSCVTPWWRADAVVSIRLADLMQLSVWRPGQYVFVETSESFNELLAELRRLREKNDTLAMYHAAEVEELWAQLRRLRALLVEYNDGHEGREGDEEESDGSCGGGDSLHCTEDAGDAWNARSGRDEDSAAGTMTGPADDTSKGGLGEQEEEGEEEDKEEEEEEGHEDKGSESAATDYEFPGDQSGILAVRGGSNGETPLRRAGVLAAALGTGAAPVPTTVATPAGTRAAPAAHAIPAAPVSCTAPTYSSPVTKIPVHAVPAAPTIGAGLGTLTAGGALTTRVVGSVNMVYTGPISVTMAGPVEIYAASAPSLHAAASVTFTNAAPPATSSAGSSSATSTIAVRPVVEQEARKQGQEQVREREQEQMREERVEGAQAIPGATYLLTRELRGMAAVAHGPALAARSLLASARPVEQTQAQSEDVPVIVQARRLDGVPEAQGVGPVVYTAPTHTAPANTRDFDYCKFDNSVKSDDEENARKTPRVSHEPFPLSELLIIIRKKVTRDKRYSVDGFTAADMVASLREEGYQLPDLCNMLAALTKKGLLSKRRDVFKMNMNKKFWFK